jgi:Spy/CpxP family protein refolding chaperone
MTFRSTRTPLLAIAALALSGFVVLAQQPPAQPAPPPPPDASTPAAAPIERQPPSGPAARRSMGDMHQRMDDMHQRMAMRPDMMQHNGPGNRGGADMMHNRDGFPGGMGGAFHIAPPGMWWKNPMVVQRLTLTPEQTRKMDDIFQQSRLQLIDLKANVEKQQVLLEPMISANPPNTAKAMAQIDKVADARANLEKANARMLLGIRGVLTPDQWTNLSTRGRGRDDFGPPAPRAPDAPVAPRQPNDSRRRAPRPSAPPTNSNAPVEPAPQP